VPFVSTIAGRIHSDKLEYNLVDHCNFSCDECSHFSPYLKQHALPLDTFVKDLRRLAEVYRVRRFRFVGGEPLLNKDILGFVAAVRDSEICKTIEVVSNGVLLDRVPDEFYKQIDSLKVSRYPDKRCSSEALEYAKVQCQQYGTLFRIEKIDSFRRMQVRDPIADDQAVSDIFTTCMIAHTWSCQTFYDGYFYLCSRPIYTGQYQQKLSEATIDFRQSDGVALHRELLLERLLVALRSSNPLAACNYCLGTVGKKQVWRQLSSAERRVPVLPPVQPSEFIDQRKLRLLLKWRRVEKFLLSIVPLRKLARGLAMLTTAVVGD
jgi:organic radical activating enzyme